MASIVLAGGGTAGHIEPALAVARVWKSQNPHDEVTFLGTAQGLENTLIPAAGFNVCNIPKVKISRRPSPSWLQIPFDLVASVKACHSLLKAADLLIGFGGYVSAPAYIAARILGVPTIIHEANAKPGWANRLGAFFTPYLAVAHGVNAGIFSKALITGLPLRSDVAGVLKSVGANWHEAREEAKRRLGFSPATPLVFVMGGSQGSVAINKVIEQSVPMFSNKGIAVLHSVGRANVLPPATDHYRPVAYVDQMADAYLAADLIIARSGAVTCAEFRALGRYALFVPLPIGNGEQFHNARSLVADGRAEVIDQKEFTSSYLQTHIDALLTSSNSAPLEGSTLDADAALKIAALGQHALEAR
ncbi:MAG: UDP-N-acetylglucosamine--N-acetylmuramyl-(pentapeptide) pyrophosphoryl-undecaprenol N-acetylglucosamine transferase [Actinobacteria bacterium]|nr:UDP-N-acetylglucosamine--N-acetylmuramyl-(pentapeptide) pyrophosphoryl-undecaprenol N-acetylglucosamine transferase [Actinomycetota bacterium]